MKGRTVGSDKPTAIESPKHICKVRRHLGQHGQTTGGIQKNRTSVAVGEWHDRESTSAGCCVRPIIDPSGSGYGNPPIGRRRERSVHSFGPGSIASHENNPSPLSLASKSSSISQNYMRSPTVVRCTPSTRLLREISVNPCNADLSKRLRIGLGEKYVLWLSSYLFSRQKVFLKISIAPTSQAFRGPPYSRRSLVCICNEWQGVKFCTAHVRCPLSAVKPQERVKIIFGLYVQSSFSFG